MDQQSCWQGCRIGIFSTKNCRSSLQGMIFVWGWSLCPLGMVVGPTLAWLGCSVQVLEKFCLGVMERRRLEHLPCGKGIGMGSSHPGFNELMEIHSCSYISLFSSSWAHVFFHSFGSKFPCAVASYPSCPKWVPSLLLLFTYQTRHSVPQVRQAWSIFGRRWRNRNVIKNAYSYWIYLLIEVKLYNCHKLYNLTRARTPFRSLFKITTINNNYTLQ